MTSSLMVSLQEVPAVVVTFTCIPCHVIGSPVHMISALLSSAELMRMDGPVCRGGEASGQLAFGYWLPAHRLPYAAKSGMWRADAAAAWSALFGGGPWQPAAAECKAGAHAALLWLTLQPEIILSGL